ncbi:MAG: 3-phosphoshikimate 1-carboxyvinyltransferase [Alphaproteobacteria bacterium]
MNNFSYKAISKMSLGSLQGETTVPGDKSISHRAIMLSSLAEGTSLITGLLESEDVLATINAFRAMGVRISKEGDGCYKVQGVGLNGLKKPQESLDMGNAGTAMRLMAGILSAQEFDTKLIGDDSLSKRPMGRIIEPLSKLGAKITAEAGGRPPLRIIGNPNIGGGNFRPKVASAQVKSAILLAGLWADDPVSVYEAIPTRDYTEKMLQDLGADIEITKDSQGGKTVTLRAGNVLRAKDINVASDISSAAFLLVAAAITPKSDLTIKNVGLHPTRDGIIRSLIKMGADITIAHHMDGQMGDIHIRYAPLTGTHIPQEWAASQIDEYPILAIAAAYATGETFMEGVGELRVKESDRLSGTTVGLKACGVQTEEGEDWFKVVGDGQRIVGGGKIQTHLDHRMAMAFLVAGIGAKEPIEIDDIRPIETSFPHFVDIMNAIGANIIGKNN